MFDLIRLNASLSNFVQVKIDTRLVPERPKIMTFRTYYTWDNGIVDWGDGTPLEVMTGEHTYAEDGIYIIKFWSYAIWFRFQTVGNLDAPKWLEFDGGNYLLDSNHTFSGSINLTSVKVRGFRREDTLLINTFYNCISFNEDISDWVYKFSNIVNMSTWLTGKSYTNYNYQWIDNILNACYDREVNGDGWGGLVKSLGLGNCRRSTASDLAFNYLKNVRGWTITLNATVIT